MKHTPVIIVGGSLVGLSASLFLSWRGVSSIVVEKHHGSSPHPRAMGFTETTIEHYRAVGIADYIPQTHPDTQLRRVRVKCLAADWTEEIEWTPGEAAKRSSRLSPCSGAAIAQDKLEPLLRKTAENMGAELRPGVELIGFRQDQSQVVATLREWGSGAQYEVSADYMIAADGATSSIREALAIKRSGVGHLRMLRSVLFSCPQADEYLARGPQQYVIEQENFRAFLTTYGDSRWVLMFNDDKDRSHKELCDAVRHALGREMKFSIIMTGRWEMAGRIADTYSKGRVFLAGDAAHQLPPTRGGFGANTGIDDVWNLAWKLERVLAGGSSPVLLDTYSEERRPIGWLRHQQAFSRPDYSRWVDGTFTPDPILSNDAMEFGQLVRSAAVIGTGPQLPAAATPSEWAGQPGTRAPHIWIIRNGERISTLDLFGRDFVLIAADRRWKTFLEGVPVAIFENGSDVLFPADQTFETTYGTGRSGASLIRPDGIIAWRSSTEPTTQCKETIEHLLRGDA